MALSFIMTIVIGIFSFFVVDFKQNELETQTNQIAKQDTDINILLTDQRRDSIVSNAVATNTFEDPEKLKKLEQQQAKLMDSISIALNNSTAAPEQKQQFNALNDSMKTVFSDLSRADLSKKEKDSLKTRFFEINKRVPGVLRKTVNQHVKAF
jgi:hypothetical protein